MPGTHTATGREEKGRDFLDLGVIVIVEDNEDDAFLMQRHLAANGIKNRMETFRSVEAAKSFLERNSGTVLLLILSVTLRTESGFELLTWMRQEPRLSRPLVLAVGNSNSAEDAQRAYDAGANAYYARGLDFGEMVSTIQTLDLI